MQIRAFHVLGLFLTLSACQKKEPAALMSYEDVLEIPTEPADHRISYGPDSLQYGDLRLPAGAGPHPVVVIIHGGCWVSAIADLTLMDAMATQLTKDGYATWNLEYRRIGDPGGAWPNTFLDVAKGINFLREIADSYALDLEHVVVTGHSAGGHLTLWQALQHQLPEDSEIFHPDPLPVSGIVSLAGIVDLSTYLQREGSGCRTHVDALVGGFPEDYPERYEQGSPIQLLPAGVPTVLITGKQDETVPLSHINPYFERAQATGEEIDNIKIDHAAHFEVISPGSTAWPAITAWIGKFATRKAGG